MNFFIANPQCPANFEIVLGGTAALRRPFGPEGLQLFLGVTAD